MTNVRRGWSASTSRSARTSLPLALTLVFLTSRFVCAQTENTDAGDEEKRARALAGVKVRFAAYLFQGQEFPRCECEQPDHVKELLGPYTIRTTFHDLRGVVVEQPRQPGLHGVVVEIVPREGRSLRRYVTLCATGGQPKPGWRFDTTAPEGLARWTGMELEVVTQHSAVIAREMKNRPAEELVRDPRIARLLGGLSLSKRSKEPVQRYNDGFALERQYWVSLERKLNRLDRVFAKPFVAPHPIKDRAAPVLREGTAAEAGMKPDAAKKIDAICQEWGNDDDQAFAVCIARKGVIVLHGAYGMRDGKPMTVTTKSWMASITKSMSATLMMMLVDQGLIELDDSAEKYLPALRGLRKGNPLTIRHLYTHTSGLEKWPAEWYQDELPDIEERVSLAYPLLAVGKVWGYNGQGYTLGGKVIEAITGEAIPQCFHRHLLGPLGCENTDVIGTHADAHSVPLDIAKFGQLLLNKGAYGKQRFFKEETFEKMLPERLTKVLGAEAKKTFGIGLDGSREKFGHGAASAATFHVDRADELVVIMTRNRMGKNQGKYGGKFWDALRDGIERSGAR